MLSVVLDSESLARLKQSEGLVEIRDQAGQLVGYFTPPGEYPPNFSPNPEVDVSLKDENLNPVSRKAADRTLNKILIGLWDRS
jgi:hypothetical protein